MDLSDCVAAARSFEVYLRLPSGAGTAPCTLHQGSDSLLPPNAGFCFAFKISIRRGVGPPNDEDWRAGGCVAVFTLLRPQHTPGAPCAHFSPRFPCSCRPCGSVNVPAQAGLRGSCAFTCSTGARAPWHGPEPYSADSCAGHPSCRPASTLLGTYFQIALLPEKTRKQGVFPCVFCVRATS